MLINNLPSDYANLTTGFLKVFEVICSLSAKLDEIQSPFRTGRKCVFPPTVGERLHAVAR